MGYPAAVDIGRQAEVEVHAEWRRDLVCEEPADAASLRVDTTDDLALVPPERLSVIAVLSARQCWRC